MKRSISIILLLLLVFGCFSQTVFAEGVSSEYKGAKAAQSQVYTRGDITGDGLVDANDLTALSRHVAKIEEISDQKIVKMADVDGDGWTDANDLTVLARYVAMIIQEFPPANDPWTQYPSDKDYVLIGSWNDWDPTDESSKMEYYADKKYIRSIDMQSFPASHGLGNQVEFKITVLGGSGEVLGYDQIKEGAERATRGEDNSIILTLVEMPEDFGYEFDPWEIERQNIHRIWFDARDTMIMITDGTQPLTG